MTSGTTFFHSYFTLYNSAENTSTKHSPHFLVHRSEPSNIFQLALRLPTKKFTDADDYVRHLTRVLKTIYSNTYENLIATQNQQKHPYDLRKRVNKANYQIGQYVWIRKDGTSKITARFERPFEILDINYFNITINDGRPTFANVLTRRTIRSDSKFG
ncbi:hypothetical protein Y032_0007g3361 [Ancylostoma ceylanicum]|uniref:Integrase catalytic domain-containing protein n=1 Tax=Ancylostoma ceylanicum TaxID=53326 RepID=A0A016VNS9_9BILA|nr:hypothetical protein Y032_0007g3361 [Ancylostoma ceylanicum]